MEMFHSQHGEDVLLARMFPHHNGVCVEVGANDGVTFSTSFYFEKIGWKCILVEPTPRLCSEIRAIRSSIVFECAASDANGEATFHVAEGIELYSSLEKNSNMETCMAAANVRITELKVTTRLLDDILLESGISRIDFISIDVEGHEISVLRGFSIARWLPKIAIIEDSTDLADTPVSIFMKEHGYVRFYRSGGNDWYASPAMPQYRSFTSLILSQGWSYAGLLKAWLPTWIRRPATLTLRAMR